MQRYDGQDLSKVNGNCIMMLLMKKCGGMEIMSADIRLVKLRRKAINHRKCPTDNEIDSGDGSSLSMDYFDIISVKSFNSSDSLEDIMDIGNSGSESRDDVSMQSYPLYCSEETLKKHESDKGYGNPFLCSGENNNMPYLSIIQVHITPEVLARVSDFLGKDCIAEFSEDIHLILKDFMDQNNLNMVYRIYQSLSAGDFAVVIRSEFTDTSFYISTLLRKRTIKKMDGSSSVQLVLYKTYTVLSIYNEEIIKNDKETINNNRFVIRCCFTNKYWSEKAQIDCMLDGIWNPKTVKSLRSLNGRYDFSVELTEQEFYRILPVIGFYKGFSYDDAESVKNNMKNKLQDHMPFDIVDYLCFLIENKYLSYVNERYLLQTENNKGVTNVASEIKVIPLKEDDKFLAQVNEEKYNELKDKAELLKIKLLRINSFRKSLNYYFGLLQKLVHLCQTINGLSDTRIYATILMQQLECVLDGMEEYFITMIECEDSEVLNGMEEYLRKSVCALDSYARYIRNNNLQSLQTPNYSLQSNASMEKLLIGYGEFLSELIEGYFQSDFMKNIGDTPRNFLPVLIPALQDGELSIEVMFSDVFLYKQSPQKKLMVVKCSTLQELTDVVGLVAAFFHEIAHQFRYETRKKRNRVLVHYGAYAAFWPLVQKVSKELCQEVGGLNECREIENLLMDAVDALFIKAWESYLKNEDYEKYEEKSLSIFQVYLENMMAFLWNDDNVWDTWLSCKNSFLENLKGESNSTFLLNLENETVQEAILIIEDTKNMYSKERVEDFRVYMNKVINAACYLWKQVYLGHDSMETSADWGKEDSYENLMKCRKMKRADYYRLNLLYTAGMRLLDEGSVNAFIYNIREKFLKDLYDIAVIKWKEQINNPKLRGGGRYLGLDENTEENETEFIDLIRSKMYAMQDLVINNVEYSIDVYREETSDIYMCTMLKLTPFGYLNFMAYNMPTKFGVDVYPEDALRLLTVILSVWATDNKDESVYRHFHSIEESIRKNLDELLAFYEKDLGSVTDTTLRFVLSEKETEYRDDEWYGDMSERTLKIAEECRNLRAEIMDNRLDFSGKEKFLTELLHYQYLCNILIVLINQFSSSQLDQTGYRYVKKDLRDGALLWKNLRTEMKSKQWWKYCEMVGNILNSPYLLYTDKRGEFFDQMIAFLQEMYYQNKIKSGYNMLYPQKGGKH